MGSDAYKRIDQQQTYWANFRRKSTLLPNHDYSAPGIHHVTLCAQGIEGRGPLFVHPALYKLMQTTWLDLPKRFSSIQLEEHQIMPDHLHFLIWLNKWPERVNGRPPYLWEVIREYKSKIAVEWIRYIKEHYPLWSAKIWQKKYDERVLRIGEVDIYRRYLRENPEKLYELMGWHRTF